jgi:hypothetical protein
MSREKPALGLDRGWEPVLRKRTCSNKKIELDADSKRKVIPPWSAQLSTNFPL